MVRHYARTDLPADLLGFLPADWLLLGALAACEAASGGGGGGGGGALAGALEWLPLLRLLHLARLYRVKKLFSYLVRARGCGAGCLWLARTGALPGRVEPLAAAAPPPPAAARLRLRDRASVPVRAHPSSPLRRYCAHPMVPQEYNLNVSLLQVTIIRNLAIVLLITHVSEMRAAGAAPCCACLPDQPVRCSSRT